MAGGSGAGGAAGSAKPPCCLHNAVIEFRLIETDKDKSRFGFDWLRVPQDQTEGITTLEHAYVNSDWSGSVTGIVEGGFKLWEEKEIKAVRNGNPSHGHVDLTAIEAQAQMKKKDVEYTSYEINRENSFFTYRMKNKQYYVPKLNLMPPVDYLLSDDELKILERYWKFIGQHVDTTLSSDLNLYDGYIQNWSAPASQRFATSNHLTNSSGVYPLIEPRVVTAGLNLWRNSIGDDQTNQYSPANSAGFFWVFKKIEQRDRVTRRITRTDRINSEADRQSVNTRAVFTNATTDATHPASIVLYESNGILRVNRLINGGSIGKTERLRAYSYGQVILMDTMTFPDSIGNSQPFPENYTHRIP